MQYMLASLFSEDLFEVLTVIRQTGVCLSTLYVILQALLGHDTG